MSHLVAARGLPLTGPPLHTIEFNGIVFSVKLYVVYDLVSAEPLSLMELSRRVIRRQLVQRRFEDIKKLPLPKSLKIYLISQ